MVVYIYIISESVYFKDGDGEIMEFENEVKAKNYLFTNGYKYEWVQENIAFIPKHNIKP